MPLLPMPATGTAGKPGAVDLHIRVHPKARLNAIEVRDDGSVAIRVTAAPEGGKANDAVVALLAERLGVARSDVVIVRGHSGRNKQVRIAGLSAGEAVALLSREAG